VPQTQSRIVGSGFTVFHFDSQPIAFLDEVQDSGQAPIRQYEAVTPLGDYFPREFALPRVKAEGTLQFTIRELWNNPVWWALSGFLNTYNIIDVYNYQAWHPQPITASTIIKKPYGIAEPTSGSTANAKPRGWTYNNVNLITIDDREIIQIGALTMPRTITAVYSNKIFFPGPSYNTATDGEPVPKYSSTNGNQPGPTPQFTALTRSIV
jgi:hypothetical protein